MRLLSLEMDSSPVWYSYVAEISTPNPLMRKFLMITAGLTLMKPPHLVPLEEHSGIKGCEMCSPGSWPPPPCAKLSLRSALPFPSPHSKLWKNSPRNSKLHRCPILSYSWVNFTALLDREKRLPFGCVQKVLTPKGGFYKQSVSH